MVADLPLRLALGGVGRYGSIDSRRSVGPRDRAGARGPQRAVASRLRCGRASLRGPSQNPRTRRNFSVVRPFTRDDDQVPCPGSIKRQGARAVSQVKHLAMAARVSSIFAPPHRSSMRSAAPRRPHRPAVSRSRALPPRGRYKTHGNHRADRAYCLRIEGRLAVPTRRPASIVYPICCIWRSDRTAFSHTNSSRLNSGWNLSRM